jgi:hypothetical protein
MAHNPPQQDADDRRLGQRHTNGLPFSRARGRRLGWKWRPWLTSSRSETLAADGLDRSTPMGFRFLELGGGGLDEGGGHGKVGKKGQLLWACAIRKDATSLWGEMRYIGRVANIKKSYWRSTGAIKKAAFPKMGDRDSDVTYLLHPSLQIRSSVP